MFFPTVFIILCVFVLCLLSTIIQPLAITFNKRYFSINDINTAFSGGLDISPLFITFFLAQLRITHFQGEVCPGAHVIGVRVRGLLDGGGCECPDTAKINEE